MARALKKKIEVKYVLDSREQNEALLKTLKLNKTFGSDKIKICEIEKKCFKALGCKTSTGDIGIEIRFEGEEIWRKTKLSIELKRNGDIFNTLFSSMKRFNNELLRSEEYGLDFYILHNWTFDDVKSQILKLQKARKIGYKTQPYLTFLNNYINVSKRVPLICCSNNFEETIRRVTKKFILENRLQY